jgi:hypothetical protein
MKHLRKEQNLICDMIKQHLLAKYGRLVILPYILFATFLVNDKNLILKDASFLDKLTSHRREWREEKLPLPKLSHTPED